MTPKPLELHIYLDKEGYQTLVDRGRPFAWNWTLVYGDEVRLERLEGQTPFAKVQVVPPSRDVAVAIAVGELERKVQEIQAAAGASVTEIKKKIASLLAIANDPTEAQ